MSIGESSFGGRRPRGSKSAPRTKYTMNSPSTKSTGPYDKDFQQNHIDGGVFPDLHRFPHGQTPPKLDNWEEIYQRIIQYRASLSPSKFPEGAHKEFMQADADAKKGDQVTNSVIPFIEGKIWDAREWSAGMLDKTHRLPGSFQGALVCVSACWRCRYNTKSKNKIRRLFDPLAPKPAMINN